LRRLSLPRLSANECAVPQSPELEAEVNKMIKVFGAPIVSVKANVIVDYLAANYGSGG
jgi:hypothetical protein